MSKKRVLVVSESHSLASGFGTYAKGVLPRLAKTDKYELAEFASYGKYDNVENSDWLYFGNMPENEQQEQMYNANPANHFGLYRFDKVLLNFKPDIVLSYRDPWMDSYISASPLRDYFHWVWMPTVDSSPQKREWLEVFKTCDALFAYSEFGEKTLLEESKGTLNVVGCASPALDANLYKPVVSKHDHRIKFGLPPDINIVGTVMRNQSRKLFLELMKSFRTFLDNAPKELGDKTFLYLHTSYPEKVGWDIAEGIMDNGLEHNVLVTYVCRHCNNFFVSNFQDAITRCKKCNNNGAIMPNVQLGLSIPDLIQIYNLFDLYVQYAICEGFGMPQVEAAACGVPVASTDYSAMSDVVRFANGYPIRVQKMFREMATGAERAYPDNDHLAEIILSHLSLSESERARKGFEARKGVMTRYDWDDTAKQWANYIDSYTPTGKQGGWDTAPLVQMSIPEHPPNLDSIEDLVRWSFAEVLQEPHNAFSYEADNHILNLQFGANIGHGQLNSFNPEQFWQMIKHRAHSRLVAERIRCGLEQMPDEFFIQQAYQRRKQ